MDAEFVQDDYTMTKPSDLNWQSFNEYGFSSHWPSWKVSAGSNYLISVLVAVVVAVGFAVVCRQCWHWCLIPLMLCGILAGADIVAWLRKEIDIVDPKAPVAGFLYLNCFLAPLLHLKYNIYGVKLYTPDWPAYFGYMAIFNAVGIVLFKVAHNIFFKRSRPVRSFWQIDQGKFIAIFAPIVVVSFLANVSLFLFFGGIVRREVVTGFEYAGHLSWILMLADPVVLLIAIGIIYWIYMGRTDKPSSFLTVLCILFLVGVFAIFLFGQRGGRLQIIAPLFIVVAMVHYLLRPIPIKLVLLSACMLFVFIYLYDFYKKLGPSGLAVFYSKEARVSMAYEREVSPLTTLLGDFARADVQASMLYRLKEGKGQFQHQLGRTYAIAAATVIPRAIWKTKPRPKLIAGSEILGYSGLKHTQRQYGLAGEAMLNFSYYGIVPAFFTLGCFLGWFRKKIATMEPSDSRFFLIPILLFLSMFVINIDSDNLMFHLLRMGPLLFAVVFLSSIRTRLAVGYPE